MTSDSKGPAPSASRDDVHDRILFRVSAIVSEISGCEAPAQDDDLANAGIDSVSRLELLARLEQEFEIEFTEDIATEFRTVNRIARVIRNTIGPSVSKPDQSICEHH